MTISFPPIAARRWHRLASGLACAALFAFLGTVLATGTAASARGALWTVFAALALLAWAYALAQAPLAPPPAPTAPDPTAELHRAKTAAEAANAAKTRYLVAVSHEIRSPLNAIYGFAQLLEREGTVTPAEAGGAIRRSAEHLTNLVEGLLEISRIESGVVKLRADVVHLPQLLDHVLGMFRMQADAKGLHLTRVDHGRIPTHVRTDEKRLRQILINLVSNAIKYTDAGTVTLHLTYRSQVATIEIADTGIGIAPADLDRIFEPFERGQNPIAISQPGIGLGLAITRMLAQVLGGEIVATSTPGEGSRFRLRLFLPEPPTAPGEIAPPRQIVGYAGPRRTLLVIDDDPAQIAVLDNLLRGLGFVVYTARNGAEGLALAGRCAPDLVLLDIQMPVLDGWAVATRLTNLCGEGLRIIMVSANVHDQPRATAIASAFVAKPVDLQVLLAEIAHHLNLSWDLASAQPPPPPAAPLPATVAPHLTRIRDLARVGHIRAVEAAVADLASSQPEAAPLVAQMRAHIAAFDLSALVRLLDARS